MNNNNALDVSVSLDRDGSVKKIEDIYAELGIILPEDQTEKDKVIQKFAKKVLEVLIEREDVRLLGYQLNQKVASGEILRDVRVMGDQLREKECKILNPTPKRKEENFETMFSKYYPESRNQSEFASLVRMKHEERPLNLVCFPLLNSGFPVEILRELEITPEEVALYAFTVNQVERLMKTHIYKHTSPDDLPYAPKCIFFVKWFDGKIRVAISSQHCDNKKSWTYATYPLQYNYSEDERAWILPEGSKLILPFEKKQIDRSSEILY